MLLHFPVLPLAFKLTTQTIEDPEDIRHISLLKFHLLRRFNSEHSAISISQNDRTFACQMVVIDLLAATVECWIVFLTHLLLETDEYVIHLNQRSRLHNASALQSLSTIVRDLELAIQYTLRHASISERRSGGNAEIHASLEAIEIELEAKTQALKNKVEDIISSSESAAEIKQSVMQEDQTLAVNRLTFLAAIFVCNLFPRCPFNTSEDH